MLYIIHHPHNHHRITHHHHTHRHHHPPKHQPHHMLPPPMLQIVWQNNAAPVRVQSRPQSLSSDEGMSRRRRNSISSAILSLLRLRMFSMTNSARRTRSSHIRQATLRACACIPTGRARSGSNQLVSPRTTNSLCVCLTDPPRIRDKPLDSHDRGVDQGQTAGYGVARVGWIGGGIGWYG